MNKSEQERILSMYVNPDFSSSFSGSTTFSKSIKIQPKKTSQILSEENSFSLHRPARKKFPRRGVICDGIDKQWNSDLIYLKRYKKENENMQYLLTIIDCCSKWCVVIPIKNKCATTVAIAFEKVMLNSGRYCKSLQVDMGKEYYGSAFTKLMDKYNIKMFSTFSEIKNSVGERFNRTILEKLARYWTHASNHKYIDVLPRLVRNYNSSYHRSIKMTPNDVCRENEIQVFNNLYPDILTGNGPPRFKINDLCRIARYKSFFDKGYSEKWSRKLYKIIEIKNKYPRHYILQSQEGEDIQGGFYEQELQIIT